MSAFYSLFDAFRARGLGPIDFQPYGASDFVAGLERTVVRFCQVAKKIFTAAIGVIGHQEIHGIVGSPTADMATLDLGTVSRWPARRYVRRGSGYFAFFRVLF